MAARRDTDYKLLFSHPEVVRDLLAGFTPFRRFGELPLDHFEHVNASYVSDHASERRGDLVWRIGRGKQLAYLLLEFQSRPDRWMALRMQAYTSLLHQDLVRRHRLAADARLPNVMPVVLYTGIRSWNAPGQLAPLLAEPSPEQAPFQPAMRYLLIDQGRLGDAPSLDAGNYAAVAFQPNVRATIAACRASLQRIEADAGVHDLEPLRQSLVKWLELSLPRGAHREESDMDAEIEADRRGTRSRENERLRLKMAVKFLDRLFEYRDVLKTGRARGLRVGLERIVCQRFGEISALTKEKFEQANEQELLEMIDRAISAPSLAAVLDRPAGAAD